MINLLRRRSRQRHTAKTCNSSCSCFYSGTEWRKFFLSLSQLWWSTTASWCVVAWTRAPWDPAPRTTSSTYCWETGDSWRPLMPCLAWQDSLRCIYVGGLQSFNTLYLTMHWKFWYQSVSVEINLESYYGITNFVVSHFNRKPFCKLNTIEMLIM